MTKPRVNSESQKELDKAQENFNAFEQNLRELARTDTSNIPVEEQEPSTKLSSREIRNSQDIYLKPKRTMFAPGQKFNEAFREEWEYRKQIVRFIVENKEAEGEWIRDIWTRPYGGIPAELWDVPVGKPVWGPRYLAEQIRGKVYDRLKMKEDGHIGHEQGVDFYGQMAYKDKKARLTAEPCPDVVTVGGFKSAFQ